MEHRKLAFEVYLNGGCTGRVKSWSVKQIILNQFIINI